MSGIYWLASYPKSGNTWFRSFLYNLQQNGDVPADINELQTGSIASGRGWLDEVLGFDTAELRADEVDRLRPAVYRWSMQDKQPGYHKIHDAYTTTADGEPLISREGTRGALYIIRNPLDLVSSLANHNQSTVNEAINTMSNLSYSLSGSRKGLPNQVRQRLLSWSEHVLSWVDVPELNCLVIRYEDMLAEPVRTFTKAAEFLQLPTDSTRIAKAIRFSDFKVLSQQESTKGFQERPPKVNQFFRRGHSGGWREELSPEQVKFVLSNHAGVMQRFGYIDKNGEIL